MIPLRDRFGQHLAGLTAVASRCLRHPHLPSYLVAIGVVLRVRQYLAGRSLWGDEAYLALNVVSRSYRGFLEPLDYAQLAPPGFLAVTKLLIGIFGAGDAVLRLFPLLCGVMSLPLFAYLARRLLPPLPAGVALFLFAVSPSVVYYSSEFKPYIVDLWFGLLLLALALRARERSRSWASWGAFVAAGVVAVWFSFPSIFVIAGLWVSFLIHRDPSGRRKWGALGAGAALTLGSASALYLLCLRSGGADPFLAEFWEDRFLGLPGFGPRALLEWPARIGTLLLGAFSRPFGFAQEGLAGVCAALGAVGLRRRNEFVVSLLILPFVVAALASCASLYPFFDRTLLFALPAALLLVAEGLAVLARHGARLAPRLEPGQARSPVSAAEPRAGWFALLVGALLVVPPAYRAGTGALLPPIYYMSRAEMIPVVRFLEANWAPDAPLFVFPDAEPVYLHYARRGALRDRRYELLDLGEDRDGLNRVVGFDREKELATVERILASGPAWLLIYPSNWNVLTQERLLLDRLRDQVWVEERFRAPGAVVYRVDGPVP